MQINEKLLQNYTNLIMPVGTIRAFYDNDDHSKFLNFEWERIATGRTLVGIDTTDNDFNEIGKNGGEKTHTLAINEMPSHSHTLKYSAISYYPGGSIKGLGEGGYWIDGVDLNNQMWSVGGDQPHNNMQPYQVVAYWRRIK